MCADMIDLKKALTKITELEEELKSTRDGYEEEIATLEEKMTILLARITTSSSTTPTRTPVKMILLMKLEQISWSLRPIKISSRPP